MEYHSVWANVYIYNLFPICSIESKLGVNKLQEGGANVYIYNLFSICAIQSKLGVNILQRSKCLYL